MIQKQHSTEAIIRILRQAETDQTNDSVCRAHNVSKAAFNRWKRKYGEMDLAETKRLKELEKKNAELKKMLAESLLKNRVLEEVNAKKWYARYRRSKPWPTRLIKGYARCVGPVAIWMYIDRLIDIRRSPFRPNNASCTSGSWRCLGNILAMGTGVSVHY